MRTALAAFVLVLVVTGDAVAQSRPEPALLAHLDSIVATAEPTLRRWGYLAVMAVLFVEAACIPAPGLTLLLAAAVLAARGELSIGLLLPLAMLGMVAGSQLAYALGRYGGRPLLQRLPLAPQRLAAIEATFARWGVLAVLVGPFPDGLRQLNGLLAGAFAMPWWRFTGANLIAVAAWVLAWGGGAWLLVEDIGPLAAATHALRPWLLGGAGLAVLGLALWLWRRNAT
ncbi:MAG: DedA family protein [Geminicoccaceae bacterium]